MKQDRPQRHEVIRPSTIIVTLILFSISALFIGLAGAYLYTLFTTATDAPRPPWIFLVTIAVLFSATRLLRRAVPAFDREDLPGLKRMLISCLFLTLIFAALQIVGWMQLFEVSPLTSSQGHSFLFILSALHLLHVAGGLPFLISYLVHVYRLGDLLFLNPEKRLYLRGLARYWRYMDVLWILLVAVLWVGYYVV